MSDLDCNTPKGREHIAQQHTIIAAVCTKWGCDAVVTPDTGDSPVDVLFARNDVLVAVAEVKSRPELTLAQLRAFPPPNDGYLITYRKIEEGIATAWKLRVPFFVFVGLADALVFWCISNAQGLILAKYKVQRTKTQATCNGGEALRENAYLSLSEMRFVIEPKPADVFEKGEHGTCATCGKFEEECACEPAGEVTADDINWM